MQVDGSCHCGKLTFRAEIDPEKAFICHCTDCQKMSGAAFRMAVRTPAEKFTLLSGSPKTYVRVAESGRKRAQVFCGDCGTHIYATSADDDGEPKLFGVRISLLKQRHAIAPKRQFWARSAQGWIGDVGAIPEIETQAQKPLTDDASPRRAVEGGCHCGHLRFRAAIEDGNVTICHCADCQAMSSSAFRVSAYARESDVTMLGAAPADYVKVAESGNRRVQAFCPRCGTQLYATSDATDGRRIFNLRVGTLEQRRELKPIRQIWVRSRLPWVTAIGAIPAKEMQ
jgi:hypothetical protein